MSIIVLIWIISDDRKSAAGAPRRDSSKLLSAYSSNSPTCNLWMVVSAYTTTWLPKTTTSCARQGYLGCA